MFRDVTADDPVAYVMSLNLHRRHLTASQAAMCAARARSIYEEQAKERQNATLKQNASDTVQENLPERKKGQARDQAGKAFGVSGRSVDHAKKVIESRDEELIAKVERGEVAVSSLVLTGVGRCD